MFDINELTSRTHKDHDRRLFSSWRGISCQILPLQIFELEPSWTRLILAFVFIIRECGELFFCISILRKLTAKVALGYPLPIFARRSVAGGSSPRAPGNQNNESTRLRLSHLIKYAKIYPWHGSVLKRRSSFAAKRKKTPTLILWAQHRKPPPEVV